MTADTLLVVHRSEDRVLVMLPTGNEATTAYYAILSEDESLCMAQAIRRMAASRTTGRIEAGEADERLCVERVQHASLPFEVVFRHEEGVSVIDLTRDEAATLADMLWAAHRGRDFHMSATLTARPRGRVEDGASAWARGDVNAGVARLLGDAARRVRGEGPAAKDAATRG